MVQNTFPKWKMEEEGFLPQHSTCRRVGSTGPRGRVLCGGWGAVRRPTVDCRPQARRISQTIRLLPVKWACLKASLSFQKF